MTPEQIRNETDADDTVPSDFTRAQWRIDRITELEAEVERLRQGLWDVWAALGGDTDGDTGPGAWIAGMGVDGFIAGVLRDATEWRRQWEDDYDADTDALTVRAEAAEAEVERLRENRGDYLDTVSDLGARWHAARARAEAAEAKLRDVEAVLDDPDDRQEWEPEGGTVQDVAVVRVDRLRAVLARSQAPQAPAEQEDCDLCRKTWATPEGFFHCGKCGRTIPSESPAAADDAGGNQ